jgi:hypothetical protein
MCISAPFNKLKMNWIDLTPTLIKVTHAMSKSSSPQMTLKLSRARIRMPRFQKWRAWTGDKLQGGRLNLQEHRYVL